MDIKILKKRLNEQFYKEYDRYILPYYKLTGIKEDKQKSFREYMHTFVDNKVDLVRYDNLDWYPDNRYVRTRSYYNQWINFFAANDLNFFKVFKDEACHRHARQHIELSCDLLTNEPTVFPVRILPERVHPGNTLIRACKFLQKPLTVLRVSSKEFVDNGIIIKECKSLDDIQQCYGDKKIFAWFYNKQKTYGLQVVVFHSNWTQFDENGNLRWRSDFKLDGKSIYPLHKFLDYLIDQTNSLKKCQKIQFTYSGKNYTLNNPINKQLSRKIFLDAIKWGNQNLTSNW
jgi:hypothetical protein